MNGRFRVWTWLLICIAVGAIIVGCDTHKGALNANQEPVVSIKTQAGDSLTVNPDGSFTSTAASDTVIFQQTIHWSGDDPDGWVVGYCYRVRDIHGNFITTPGHASIDSDGWVLQDKTKNTGKIPYDGGTSVDASLTKWTEYPYAVINFPACNSEFANNAPSVLEVMCIDNRGQISQISRKIFSCKSSAPRVIISTSSGDLDADTKVGMALRFRFDIGNATDDSYEYNLLSGNRWWYFEYCVKKVDKTTGALVEQSDWLSTQNYTNPQQVLIRKVPYGAQTATLSSDFNEAGNLVTQTRLIARVRDVSGMYSPYDSVSFSVTDKYAPGTVIYPQKCFAIGSNHYMELCGQTDQDAPVDYTTTGTLVGTPFFKDITGTYAAIWSADFNVTMKWGYNGEYNDNNPAHRQSGAVLDEVTNYNYRTEITSYQVRLDGRPFEFPALMALPNYETDYIYTDENNDKWLQIPASKDMATEIVLSNLLPYDENDPSTLHKLIVRAVDLQGVPDPTPDSLVFKLVAPVSADAKHGVLIIDDDTNLPSTNALNGETEVDNFYNNIAASLTGDYAAIDRNQIVTGDYFDGALHSGNSGANTGMDALSPTDLQKYKLVIWHSDSRMYSSGSNLWKEIDVLRLYLKDGGNLIVSGGDDLRPSLESATASSYTFFHSFFGLPLNYASKGLAPAEMYFQGATSVAADYPNLALNITNSFDQGVGTLHRMGSVMVINWDTDPNTSDTPETVTPLYTVDLTNPPANIASGFSGKVCGFYNTLQSTMGTSQKCAMFSFGLSYMQADQVQAMVSALMADTTL
jgi:hypothetical protein